MVAVTTSFTINDENPQRYCVLCLSIHQNRVSSSVDRIVEFRCYCVPSGKNMRELFFSVHYFITAHSRPNRCAQKFKFNRFVWQKTYTHNTTAKHIIRPEHKLILFFDAVTWLYNTCNVIQRNTSTSLRRMAQHCIQNAWGNLTFKIQRIETKGNKKKYAHMHVINDTTH